MFDLLNVNIGGGNRPHYSNGSNNSTGNAIQAGGSKRVSCVEEKAAKKFLEAINTMSFDHFVFAYFISTAGSALNVRAFKILSALIDIWADRLDSGLYSSDDEYNIAVEAARLREYLKNFRP